MPFACLLFPSAVIILMIMSAGQALSAGKATSSAACHLVNTYGMCLVNIYSKHSNGKG